MLKTAANRGFGNIVPARLHARTYAGEMQFRRGKTRVPYVDLEPLIRGLRQRAWNTARPQSGFKREIQTLLYRIGQQIKAAMPSRAVSIDLA